MGAFASQTETIQVHTAELNIARTAVLDYFTAQAGAEEIFTWEDGNGVQEGTNKYVSAIAKELAFPKNSPHRVIDAEKSGPYHILVKNYPEFEAFRDICFFYKYFLNTDLGAFPEPKGSSEYKQSQAMLLWDFSSESQKYRIRAFNGSSLTCKPPKGKIHRCVGACSGCSPPERSFLLTDLTLSHGSFQAP